MNNLKEYLDEYYSDEELAIYDGFDGAFVGVGFSFNRPFVCYSRRKMLGILMDDGCMSIEEANEYIDFNIRGSYIGVATPIVIDDDL